MERLGNIRKTALSESSVRTWPKMKRTVEELFPKLVGTNGRSFRLWARKAYEQQASWPLIKTECITSTKRLYIGSNAVEKIENSKDIPGSISGLTSGLNHSVSPASPPSGLLTGSLSKPGTSDNGIVSAAL